LDAPGASGFRRIATVDVLRGLIMIIMALDHTRDFFSNAGVDPTNPLQSWPLLFFTRWITHLCAPGFVALAGTSVYLQKQRGRSANDVAFKLLTRGVWLIFVEVAIVSFGLFFTYHFHFLPVIYAIGASMILLAALQYLPTRWVAVYGLAVVLLHNLLDPIHAAQLGAASGAWKLLISDGSFMRNGKLWVLVMYPVIPWSGIMALGYAFGRVVLLPGTERRRRSLQLGVVALALFAILRMTRVYGDPIVFHPSGTLSQRVMAFFQVTKYPPSLDYTCATLGFLLLLFVLIDKALEARWITKAMDIVEIYGRVPFFYYVIHFYVLHISALIALVVVTGAMPSSLSMHMFNPSAKAITCQLPVVYLIWIALVALMYWPCKWFAGVKARRRDWWLSYL
jgi:uncharacterized membrane protein